MNKLHETRIHIVLPFRGREDYFKETVRSVLTQTYKNWNLTIFDNASESTKVATWIADLNDERIKYLRFENQVSLVRNFRRAVDGIDAEWALILGADDTLEKNFLSAGLSTIDNFPLVSAVLPRVVPIDSESHISWTLVDRVNRVARPLKSDGVFENHEAIARLCITNWMYITSMLVRKETFKTFPFDLDLENTFDLDFMFKMLIAGNSVAFSSEAVFYYRRHSQTASLNIDLALARAKEEQLIFTTLSNRFWDRRQFFLYVLSKLRIGYRAYVFVRALKMGRGLKWALIRIALSPGAKISI